LENIIPIFIFISLLSRLQTAEMHLEMCIQRGVVQTVYSRARGDVSQGGCSTGEHMSSGSVLGMLKVMDP